MPERKLRKVQRQILLAHLVAGAHNSALQERPERINDRRMDVAHIFVLAVFHRFVIVIPVQQPIAGMFIGRNERDFVVYPLDALLTHDGGRALLRCAQEILAVAVAA